MVRFTFWIDYEWSVISLSSLSRVSLSYYFLPNFVEVEKMKKQRPVYNITPGKLGIMAKNYSKGIILEMTRA